MAHKYPNILIHCVFSTKGRENLISAELLPKLWKYLVGIGRNHGFTVLAAGGIPNHAHLLIALPSGITPVPKFNPGAHAPVPKARYVKARHGNAGS